ncbi:endonuclease/exonuclease/phosphatase family protein [Nocardioides caeni]|uniref:Endonuclease/exonuclease/phosphatase domain-containing protein n=1 Tax=Nocardioides caeni TaxID=574700 RepID=A0A4S8N2Y2_9ACTN|nr:endonuclease/exonuclease/phosphatase family protein [Nocardioides caeni]THV10115.1 hypothetical protein E9934_14990 [Nocardioides caeni]
MSEDRPGEPDDQDESADDRPDESAEESAEEESEESDESVDDAPEGSGRLDLPRAVAPGGPGAQVATIAAAVIVLVVVALVFVFNDARSPDAPEGRPSPTVTTGPQQSGGPEPTVYDTAVPGLDDIPTLLCPTATLKHAITVLAFNIHYATVPGGSVQLAAIGREIKTWDPDVVLLQEVDDGRPRTGGVGQAKALADATGMAWVYGGNARGRGGSTLGNAILSKFPIEESTNSFLPVAGGREQRGLLHAVLDVNGKDLSFYSLHLDHSRGGARTVQARAVAEILGEDPRPKVLGGDFNAGPGTVPVGILRAAGLGDAWSAGSGSGATVPARAPRARIDYVLHDGSFTALQAVVLRSGVSDHRAVWSRLVLSEKLECIQVGER